MEKTYHKKAAFLTCSCLQEILSFQAEVEENKKNSFIISF